MARYPDDVGMAAGVEQDLPPQRPARIVSHQRKQMVLLEMGTESLAAV